MESLTALSLLVNVKIDLNGKGHPLLNLLWVEKTPHHRCGLC